ncbi:Tyrosine recombinase XerA [uncultured archaeon]|nr:Tyrosine recombinase XerA [uncultured archaeon]
MHQTKNTFDSLYSSSILSNAIVLVKESKLSKENKTLILDFANNCLARGLTKLRVRKYLFHLRRIAEELNKPLNKADRKDIEKLINWLNDTDYSPNTLADFRVALKVFYKYLEAEKLGLTIRELEMQRKEPQIVSWFSSRIKKIDKKLPEQLLTQEDILALIKSAPNIRDKAFIATLYESGARIGEIGTLRIKNISFDEYGIKANLSGKTGSRTIRLISCCKYLTDWINQHPNKDNSEAPLWVGYNTKELLNYTSLSKLLRVARKRAGINKPINPHSFRHSRATELAQHFTEQQLKAYLGWTAGSDMASVYVHLSGKDLDNAMLSLHGLMPKKADEQPKLMPKKCLVCGELNEPIASFCIKCRTALTLEVAITEDVQKEIKSKELEIKMKILESKFDELTNLIKMKVVK